MRRIDMSKRSIRKRRHLVSYRDPFEKYRRSKYLMDCRGFVSYAIRKPDRRNKT